MRIRNVAAVGVIALLAAGCSAGSSTAGAGGPDGCIEAQDASGTIGQVITGIHNKTETNHDIEDGFKSAASQLQTVTLIANGPLKAVAADAGLRAARIRVQVIDNSTNARDVNDLAGDLKKINTICPPG